MKKIIHLSDLHVGYGNLTGKLRDLVSRIIFHKQPANDYIIIITGDIVQNANKDGSFEEASAQLDRLKQAGFHVLPVMGNHDCGTGVAATKKNLKKFKKHFYGDKKYKFPKLDIIDDIAFIGLNSMAGELKTFSLERFGAEGELGKKQRNILSTQLTSNKVQNCTYKVIYLHHHPFDPQPFHHLKDSVELGEILVQHKIDALLFGHNHAGLVWNGHWNIQRAYDGGTSTGKKGSPNPHRVIDLSTHPSKDYDAKF